MKGIIIDEGFKFYTDMRLILAPIEDIAARYNWLVTNHECYWEKWAKFENENGYAWLSGSELLDFVKTGGIQFVWAVFSGFQSHIPLEKILEYDRPYADGYSGFWKNPISLQHPLAEIEIVAFDSTFTLCIAKDEKVIDALTSCFPQAKDLEEFNSET